MRRLYRQSKYNGFISAESTPKKKNYVIELNNSHSGKDSETEDEAEKEKEIRAEVRTKILEGQKAKKTKGKTEKVVYCSESSNDGESSRPQETDKEKKTRQRKESNTSGKNKTKISTHLLNRPLPYRSGRVVREVRKNSKAADEIRKGAYVLKEDQAIVDFITGVEDRYLYTCGLELWYNAQKLDICPGRTVYSMKERFRKHIIKNLSSYKVPPEVIRRIRNFELASRKRKREIKRKANKRPLNYPALTEYSDPSEEDDPSTYQEFKNGAAKRQEEDWNQPSTSRGITSESNTTGRRRILETSSSEDSTEEEIDICKTQTKTTPLKAEVEKTKERANSETELIDLCSDSELNESQSMLNHSAVAITSPVLVRRRTLSKSSHEAPPTNIIDPEINSSSDGSTTFCETPVINDKNMASVNKKKSKRRRINTYKSLRFLKNSKRFLSPRERVALSQIFNKLSRVMNPKVPPRRKIKRKKGKISRGGKQVKDGGVPTVEQEVQVVPSDLVPDSANEIDSSNKPENTNSERETTPVSFKLEYKEGVKVIADMWRDVAAESDGSGQDSPSGFGSQTVQDKIQFCLNFLNNAGFRS